MRLIQSGPRDAKIVLVGEAPGATEDQHGIPFAGGSGQLLNMMLSRVGISRDSCFVTNLCHVRPPANDFNWFIKPKPRLELIHGLVQLKNDLTEIQPNIVVALGSQPLRFLTNKLGIDKWRGSVLESTLVPGLKVIGTYHPAYILRIWDYKAVAELDLKRVVKESVSREIQRPIRDLVLDPSREDSGWLVSDLLNATYLSVDIECFETDSGWRLACVGFSDRANRAVVWPYREQWQRDMIKQLCESDVAKVFQNGTFDVTVLRDNSIHVPIKSFVWDTMLAHHSLFAECAGGGDEMSALGGKKRQAAIQKGLAFQTSIYTDEMYYKEDGKLWKETGNLQMFHRYNALDAAVTREIRDVQAKEITEFGVQQVFDHEMSLIEPLMAMTTVGIKIDMELRESLRVEYEKQINNLQIFLDNAAGGSVNVKSSKQVIELLYNKLSLAPKRKQRKSGESTPTADKDAIIELAGKNAHPILHVILEIRQRRDFVERYLTAKVDNDNRMRCAFDITGTRSGRLSSRQSIYGSGTNLQNIPSRKPEGEAIRRMFIADEGMCFVYRDLSQAEARVVAYLANCRGLIELFEDPSRDIHTENAARIFGKHTKDVSETERYLAKRVVHAANYGMGPDRLVQVVNEDAKATGVRIDQRQARSLIDRYFLLYPEIREVFWKQVENELRYTRTLTTPFGRKRMFFGRWDDKLLREAYSYIPQSTVGDLCCKGLVRCFDSIQRPGLGQLLLQVHDSILVQCNKDKVNVVASLMSQAMEIPIRLGEHEFIIPTDCKVGLNWGANLKNQPELNPNGLMDISKWLVEHA